MIKAENKDIKSNKKKKKKRKKKKEKDADNHVHRF